jgi:hypothetical protein
MPPRKARIAKGPFKAETQPEVMNPIVEAKEPKPLSRAEKAALAAAKKIAKKEATAKKESEPKSPKKEAAVKPAKKETAPKPVKKEPTPKPVKKEPAPKPVKKEPAPKPVKKEPAPKPVKKEPAPKPVKKEPAPKPAEKEPAPKSAKKEPAVEPTEKEPTVEPKVALAEPTELERSESSGVNVFLDKVNMGDMKFPRVRIKNLICFVCDKSKKVNIEFVLSSENMIEKIIMRQEERYFSCNFLGKEVGDILSGRGCISNGGTSGRNAKKKWIMNFDEFVEHLVVDF